jgi:TATA-binding protein-associated factor Taf7
MGTPISFKARQRFRQRLHNIEDADEILDALDKLIERFTLISGSFSSNNWETIYELEPNDLETLMITFSIIGKESSTKQAGLKRTAVFYKENGIVTPISIQQSDFTTKSDNGFNARILADGSVVKLQVKGATNNFTKWRGSIEIEKLGE